MVIDMNEAQVRTLQQVRQVLACTLVMEFQAAADDDEGRYAWIETVLKRFDDPRLARADRGPVLVYVKRLSGTQPTKNTIPGLEKTHPGDLVQIDTVLMQQDMRAHSPVVTAKEIARLDKLSGGRFDLGVNG